MNSYMNINQKIAYVLFYNIKTLFNYLFSALSKIRQENVQSRLVCHIIYIYIRYLVEIGI